METSLWQVSRATVSLSFTVKEEDLGALRAWVVGTGLPLYILQVFFDEAHALPFGRLEALIASDTPPDRRILPEVDRFTKKPTYKVPLSEGVRLGAIPEPEVEGRLFKAPNGRVTVYGRLSGPAIEAGDQRILEEIAKGHLRGSKSP
ncbi:MAG TPA: hypothetical protein VLF66_09035 [Thermoanaerobaculia bacterium]|nr:hypothetical protein [Thermoanaerobaculia bacterium]